MSSAGGLGSVTLLARKANRQVAETVITAEQLLADAVKQGKLPAKRFRVEGSPAGASVLLTSARAASAKMRYGGRIVELVTRRSFWTTMSANLPSCRTDGCHASAGLPCRDAEGPRRPHANRVGKSETVKPNTQAAAKLGPCDECGAQAGMACRTPKKKTRKPHKSRQPQPGGAE